jgi:hypothetical protein
MKIIDNDLDICVLRQHEKNTQSNVTLGSYHLDKHCPLEEFAIHRVRLEADDCNRLFMLGEFAKYSKDRSGRLHDVQTLDERAEKKIASLIASSVDLRSRDNLELVIVSADAQTGSLVIIDGNHRAIAQYRIFGHTVDVPSFVCIHPNVNQWPFVPLLARSAIAN